MKASSALLNDAQQFQKPADISKFLSSSSFDKKSNLRILSWLFSLRIIHFPFDYKEINSLRRSYQTDYLDKFLKSPSNDEKPIKQDLDRTISWFKKLIKNNNISVRKNLPQLAYDSSYRILSILSLSDSFYRYLQGYDRYVFIFLILGYDALKKSDNFVEALAFYLMRAFLKFFNPSRFTINREFGLNFFYVLDAKIASARPDIAQLFKHYQVSSLHYAVRWALLSFADEHNLQEIFLLWDHILVNQNKYLDYISELCVGHVIQIEPVKSEHIIQTIQAKENWDVVKAIHYADSHLVNTNPTLKILLLIGYIILLLVTFYYLSSKKKIK